MGKRKGERITLFRGVEPMPEYRATLQDLATLHSKLNEMRVRNRNEYYGCCANFHQFVISAITEHNRRGGSTMLDVRVVGMTPLDAECVKYQIVYRHPAGARETFLVAKECLCGMEPVKAADRLYAPQAA